MFARPRPKKSILPPPAKRRKPTLAVEEITFDDGAREEYLTGFHKRKLQRIKHAQEEAARRARQERLETRKQIRDERQRDIAEHVETVNKLLRESAAATASVDGDESQDEDADEWDGFPDKPDLDIVDHEEEYIDEDRYTTVKIETVSVSRDGLSKSEQVDEEEGRINREGTDKAENEAEEEKARQRTKKKKKKKFRYESKIERQLTDKKQRSKSRKH